MDVLQWLAGEIKSVMLEQENYDEAPHEQGPKRCRRTIYWLMVPSTPQQLYSPTQS